MQDEARGVRATEGELERVPGGAHAGETQRDPGGLRLRLTAEERNHLLGHRNDPAEIGRRCHEVSDPRVLLDRVQPAEGRGREALGRIQRPDRRRAVRERRLTVLAAGLRGLGHDVRQEDVVGRVRDVQLDDAGTAVTAGSQDRPHGIVEPSGRDREAADAAVGRNVEDSTVALGAPEGLDVDELAGDAVTAPGGAAVGSGPAVVLLARATLTADGADRARLGEGRPVRPELVVLVPGEGVLGQTVDDHAAGGREDHVAAGATARAATDAVEEVGVLTTAAFTALGGDAPALVDVDVADGEDADATGAAATAAALLVPTDLEGDEREGVRADRVAAAATAGTGVGGVELTHDEGVLDGDHLAEEVVHVRLVEEGLLADLAANGAHGLADGALAVRRPASAALGVEADELLGTHQSGVGVVVVVEVDVGAEAATATAGTAPVVGATRVVGGLPADASAVGLRERAEAVAALGRRLRGQEGARAPTTAAAVAAGAELGLVGGVQGADTRVVGAVDQQLPEDLDVALGEDRQRVGADHDDSGAREDPEVIDVQDAVDDRLGDRRDAVRTAEDLAAGGVEDDGLGAAEADDPVEVPAGSTRAAEVEARLELALAPGRARNAEGRDPVLTGARRAGRDLEALGDLVELAIELVRGHVDGEASRSNEVAGKAVAGDVAEALADVEAHATALRNHALRGHANDGARLRAVGEELDAGAEALEDLEAGDGLVLEGDELARDVVRRRDDRLVEVHHDRPARAGIGVLVDPRQVLDAARGNEGSLLRGDLLVEVEAVAVGRLQVRGVHVSGADACAVPDPHGGRTRDGVQEERLRVVRDRGGERHRDALTHRVPHGVPHRDAVVVGVEDVQRVGRAPGDESSVRVVRLGRAGGLEADLARIGGRRERAGRRQPARRAERDGVQPDRREVHVLAERDVDGSVDLPHLTTRDRDGLDGEGGAPGVAGAARPVGRSGGGGVAGGQEGQRQGGEARESKVQ